MKKSHLNIVCTASMSDIAPIREEAFRRAGNVCEWANCDSNKWLELAHLKDIGMGGNKARKYNVDNTAVLCKWHHDIYDGRQSMGTKVAYRELLEGYLDRHSGVT
jgi:predicted restriction endonuclease